MTLEISIKLFLKKIEDWDNRVFLDLYERKFLRKKSVVKFAQVYSFFGNIFIWGSLWIFLGIFGLITKDYDLFILMTAGFEQSLIMYLLIRYIIVKRNRPYIKFKEHGVKQGDELIREKRSFPSGHVTFFLFFGFVFAFHFNSWQMLLIFIILDIFMAISRVILGVHYPIDVIFGFIFGAIFAFSYLALTYPYWAEFYYWIGNILSPFG
ncbi:MAG: phosphatase PAP2 family protein [Candidatus Lokiarchaeota archaeon]|nr:phosphatase PAP2 family protein [Candidatus Lokiarchaeota archaeon]